MDPRIASLHELGKRKIYIHRAGDWFCSGMITTAFLSTVFATIPISPFWMIPIGLALGWYFNERERKRQIAIRQLTPLLLDDE